MASDQAAQIGARLRARREDLGLTRRQLALKLPGVVTENDLYRWESGRHKPADDTLAALAVALERDYAWAVGSAPDGPAPDLMVRLSPEGDLSEQLEEMQDQLERIEALVLALVDAKVAETVLREHARAKRQRTAKGSRQAA